MARITVVDGDGREHLVIRVRTGFIIVDQFKGKEYRTFVSYHGECERCKDKGYRGVCAHATFAAMAEAQANRERIRLQPEHEWEDRPVTL